MYKKTGRRRGIRTPDPLIKCLLDKVEDKSSVYTANRVIAEQAETMGRELGDKSSMGGWAVSDGAPVP